MVNKNYNIKLKIEDRSKELGYRIQDITFGIAKTKNQNPSTKSYYAFTLVELIVVIVILSILATIAFLSFSSQSSSARDSSRLSDTTSISKGLGVFSATSGAYPAPDNFVTIKAGTGFEIYQGQAGSKVLSMIKMSDAKDILDGTYYSYSVDITKSHYSLGGFLENPPSSLMEMVNPFSTFYNSSNAIDFSKRYFIFKGDPVGILTESGTVGSNINAPIEQTTPPGTPIYITSTNKSLILNVSKSNQVYGSGSIAGIIQSLQNGIYNFNAPSDCAPGFISVQGSLEFNQPGFCVAKYEMRQASGDAGNFTWDGTYWVPAGNAVGTPYCSNSAPCSYTNSRNFTGAITSKPTGYPIAFINQYNAIEACKSIGSGYHLITEDEWMTLARNIEQQANNWSSGIVGSGYLYSGHNDDGPDRFLSSTADDADGYYQTGDASTGIGDNVIASFPTNVAQSYKGQKRTLVLSNGQVIWDLAGNVWEHVNKVNTIDGGNYNNGNNWKSNACGTVDNWYSFNLGESIGGSTQGICSYQNGYSAANIGPITPNLNVDNGVGRIFSYSNIGNNAILRGGAFEAGPHAGIYSIFLGMTSADTIYNTGFRCAK